MMGRPADLGYQRIDTIDPIDDFDEVEVADELKGTWYVQVAAGDVRIVSSEQVRDFLRLGVIHLRTFIWQQGMQQWLPLSNYLSAPAAPPASSVQSDLPTQPFASSRPPPGVKSMVVPASAQAATAARSPTTRSGTYNHVEASAVNAVRSTPPTRTSQRAPAKPATLAAASAAPAVSSQRATSVPPAAAPQRVQAAVTSAPPAAAPLRAQAAATSAPPAAAPQRAPAASDLAAAKASDGESWSVLMGPGDVRVLSLEQLDDFFRLGVIDEETYVWQDGMSGWSQLSAILGADEEEANDTWYALLAPGEVKTLTLEQLDDFFRLDIIDERTPVWQEGMAQWLPLGMVAGIEPEPFRPAAAPPLVQAPAPRAAPVSPLASPLTRSALPLVATPKVQNTFTSAAPVALSIPVPEAPQHRKSWLLRIAVAAGLFITIFRNDVAYSIAEAASQKGQYLQAERSVLGGPIFGSTRAVEALVAETGGRMAPVRLPWLVTEAQTNKLASEKKLSAERASAAEAAKVAAAQAQAKAAAEAKAQSAQAASATASKAANGGDVAAALAGAPAKPKFSSVKAAATPRGAAVRKKSGKGQGGPFTGKGDYYDPLNGAM